ncbi:Chymotrypsin-like protease CTRL-1 [Bos mutus]|uniref:Chymotrypsin-like protease CTRL-1 n=1 Tax=Bos mutus TaxID=72004 RepID=L8IJY5_9CETA|nr:Chymotrypsin-like protease CTRL-1 [Bos mutus]
MLLLRLTFSLILLSSSWVQRPGCCVLAIKPVLHFSQRTVNGKMVVLGSWPWEDSKGFCFCGGFVIGQSRAVTAAHCNVVGPGCHFVILGEYDRASCAECLGRRWERKGGQCRHPSWNPTTMNNDLTLLTLASPAQYTMCVSPVFLASSNEALPEGLTWLGASVVQCDLGTPAAAGSALLTVRRCQQYRGSCITSSTICQGPPCASYFSPLSRQGDSGGLLVCQKGNTWVLTDTVSWGTSDCSVPTPAMYTRVSRFSTWVNQVTAYN